MAWLTCNRGWRVTLQIFKGCKQSTGRISDSGPVCCDLVARCCCTEFSECPSGRNGDGSDGVGVTVGVFHCTGSWIYLDHRPTACAGDSTAQHSWKSWTVWNGESTCELHWNRWRFPAVCFHRSFGKNVLSPCRRKHWAFFPVVLKSYMLI